MKLPKSYLERGRELLGMDLRSLAAFRIGLGCVVLVDLAFNRFPDTWWFYSDLGALPRSAILEHASRAPYVSLHMASGSAAFAACLFAIAAGFALMLAAGYRTRLATIASWILMVSLHNRAPLVLQGGDVVLRMLLFWAMFLPLGARWSLDALRDSTSPRRPRTHLSAGTIALLVQMASIYVFTAWLKTGDAWERGSAVYYALSIDSFAREPFASFLLGHGQLLYWLTKGVVVWEAAAPFLLLVPICFGPFRSLVVLGFIALHVGFSLGLKIGLFSPICIVGWLAFLPGWFWERRGGTEPKWTVEAPPRPNPFAEAAALAFLCLGLSWNLSTVDDLEIELPSTLKQVGRLIRIDQKWSMFAPQPMTDDGWYVIPGKTVGGRDVELWRTGTDTAIAPARPTLAVEKPACVSCGFPNQRWRKYMRNLWLKENAQMRLYYGRALCRDYNERRAMLDALATFRIVYMREITPPPGALPDPIEEVQIWDHFCFDEQEVAARQGRSR